MPKMTRYPHGTFSWVELSTTDVPAAKSFYGALFGWETKDTPVPGGGTYTMCVKNGDFVSAMQVMQEGMQGHQPFWLSYVTIDDVDAVTARVPELGGTVMAPVFDVMDAGRMSVIQDPQGAGLALWQAKDHPGAGLVTEPGALCWNELATNDVDAAREFYTALLGWRADTQDMGGMEYTVFSVGDRSNGGMTRIDPQAGDMRPSWSVSFAVEDCDESAAAIKDLGGNLVIPATDFPGGRFSVATDPQGGFFGIVKIAAVQ